MMQIEHRGLVTRNIADDMMDRQLIEQLTQCRNSNSYLSRNILLIDRNRVREESGISPHQKIQKHIHARIWEFDVIEFVPLDDIRAFNYLEKRATQIYCEKYVEDSLRMEFSYAFAEKKYPGAPEWEVHRIDENPFTIMAGGQYKTLEWTDEKGYIHTTSGGDKQIHTAEIIPIRGRHFKLPVLGFRFGDIAYCTDMNHIPEEEFPKLQGLKHFIINTVRRGHHISHFALEGALKIAERVEAQHTWLTHLSHQLPCHEALAAELPSNVRPAYDGLVIE